ncbi:MAG: LURP-one-related family protein [Clostridia bacterium]|nr:LURP-one-related family protein [Clostridia bacterium]
MRLLVENKLISIGGGSVVKDEEGQVVYTIKGKWLSPTKKKIIKDAQGNKLFVVRNKWFNFLHHTAYIFNAEGESVGQIRKNKYSITNSFGAENFSEDYKILGKFFSRKLDISRNDKEYAVLTMEWSWFVDKYSIETNAVEDMPLLVAMVIAIDNVKDKRLNQES